MKKLAPFLASLALGLAATAGAAAPESPAMAPIHAFVEGFNKGDAKAAAAALSPTNLVIVDDVAPHVWTGSGAFEAWAKALEAQDKAEGNTDGSVTLGKPVQVKVTGDRAYVVMRATYNFKRKGTAMTEPSQFICTLQKGAGGWLINSWTWAGSVPKAVAAK